MDEVAHGTASLRGPVKCGDTRVSPRARQRRDQNVRPIDTVLASPGDRVRHGPDRVTRERRQCGPLESPSWKLRSRCSKWPSTVPPRTNWGAATRDCKARLIDRDTRTVDRGGQARNRRVGVVDRGIGAGDRGTRVVSSCFGLVACAGFRRSRDPVADERCWQPVARHGHNDGHDGPGDGRDGHEAWRRGSAIWVVALDREAERHDVGCSLRVCPRDRSV
jgi:hypothetical protein